MVPLLFDEDGLALQGPVGGLAVFGHLDLGVGAFEFGRRLAGGALEDRLLVFLDFGLDLAIIEDDVAGGVGESHFWSRSSLSF